MGSYDDPILKNVSIGKERAVISPSLLAEVINTRNAVLQVKTLMGIPSNISKRGVQKAQPKRNKNYGGIQILMKTLISLLLSEIFMSMGSFREQTSSKGNAAFQKCWLLKLNIQVLHPNKPISTHRKDIFFLTDLDIQNFLSSFLLYKSPDILMYREYPGFLGVRPSNIWS